MREVTAKQFADLLGCAESTARKRLKEMKAPSREKVKRVAVSSAYERHNITSRYFVYQVPEEYFDNARKSDPGQ